MSPSSKSDAACASAPASFQSVAFQNTLETLPWTETLELRRALHYVPQLVERESPLSAFLATEQGNLLAACRRLATYWRLRTEIFATEEEEAEANELVGTTSTSSNTNTTSDQNKAWKPLNFLPNGIGALDDEQNVELLQTGAWALLPRDSAGRSVLFVDRSKWSVVHSFPHYHQAKKRILFYFLHLMAQNTASQRPAQQRGGIVVVGWQSGGAPAAIAIEFCVKLVTTAFPFSTAVWHIVFPPNSIVGWCLNGIQGVTKFFMTALGNYADRAQIHHADSQEVILQQLAVHGLARKRLPTSLGGEWNAFESWLKRQYNLEEKQHAAFLQQQAFSQQPQEHKQLAPVTVASNSSVTEDDGAQQQDRSKKKRSATAQSSKERRQRQKENHQQLQSQCENLKQVNLHLKQENEQLECLLEQAREEAAFLSSMEQEHQKYEASIIEQQQKQQQQNSASSLLMALEGEEHDFQQDGPAIIPQFLDQVELDSSSDLLSFSTTLFDFPGANDLH